MKSLIETTWTLLDGVTADVVAGKVRVRAPRLEVRLADAGGTLGRALACLRAEATWDDLLDLADSVEGIAALDHGLHRLRALGVLRRTLRTPMAALATLVPMAHRGLGPYPASSPRRLSRFAHVRLHEGMLCLETPLAPFRIVLHDWRGPALLSAGAACPDIPKEVNDAFWDILADGGMLTEGPPMWGFHDLVFHAASRLGRHDRPYGGTWPHEGRLPPLPACRASMGGNRVVLARPDVARLQREDPPLASVVESRRSLRVHGDPPVSLDQIGELLFRTLRTIEVGHDGRQEIVRRPHANAGALGELEAWLTIDRCLGLDAGMYHYDSHEHALEALEVDAGARQAWLDFARRGSGLAANPQVLITLTSRFGRLAWKYEGMAYAATLKDVGIVLHNVTLAATAMGLAACPLGGGDADLFAAATGLDYYEEAAVGELMLGST